MRAYSIPASAHFPEGVKYSFSYIKEGVCVLRYDNERLKGHHMHNLDIEERIEFSGIEKHAEQFEKHIRRLRGDNHESQRSDGKS